MIPFGDGKIGISPGLLVLEAVLMIMAVNGIIRLFLYLIRISGANLALQQAKREFPLDAVVSAVVKKEKGRRFAYLTMTSGKVHKYLIVPEDEAAIRQRNT